MGSESRQHTVTTPPSSNLIALGEVDEGRIAVGGQGSGAVEGWDWRRVGSDIDGVQGSGERLR